MIFQSPLLEKISGIQHGFGTASEEIPEIFQSWWENRCEWKQVHGNAIHKITQRQDHAGEVDALYTEVPGVPVAIRTADCVPILLARKDGKKVAGVHAGWRGTEKKIIEALWQRLLDEGEHPENWVAAIGPCIHGEVYEVSQELVLAFCERFPRYPRDQISPKPRHLDLVQINVLELTRLGIKEISIDPHCTYQSKDSHGAHLLHSYRREGAGTRQYSVIGIVSQK